MANPEHIEIALKGKEAIAAWRKDHPETVLDLSGAMLSGIDLCEADLCKSNLDLVYLFTANLHSTKLRGASLIQAHLLSTCLENADLSGANLTLADLTDANLTKANMMGVNMQAANLLGTYLNGANLSDALMGGTVFGNVDLSDVHGLDTVEHTDSSTIGIDTLFKSQGKIPESFLLACGVPEVLIEYLPSLIGQMQPIQFYSCFISYSSKDEEFTKRLHGRLEQEKLRVWYAPEDLKGGRKLDSQIDEAIRVHDKLLLVLSPDSMSSEWVRREIKKACKKEKLTCQSALFPIGLVPFGEIRKWECLDSDSGEDLAEKVREYHTPDFSCWKDHDKFEAAFAKLMADLRASASPQPPTTK